MKKLRINLKDIKPGLYHFITEWDNGWIEKIKKITKDSDSLYVTSTWFSTTKEGDISGEARVNVEYTTGEYDRTIKPLTKKEKEKYDKLIFMLETGIL